MDISQVQPEYKSLDFYFIFQMSGEPGVRAFFVPCARLDFVIIIVYYYSCVRYFDYFYFACILFDDSHRRLMDPSVAQDPIVGSSMHVSVSSCMALMR